MMVFLFFVFLNMLFNGLNKLIFGFYNDFNLIFMYVIVKDSFVFFWYMDILEGF